MGSLVTIDKGNGQLQTQAVNDFIKVLGIKPKQAVDRAAIRLTFQRAAFDNINELKERRHSSVDVDHIRNTIQFKHELFSKYSKNFFIGMPFERDALIIAMICDEHVVDIYPHRTGEASLLYFSDIPKLKCKLTKDLLSAADGIWNEAVDMGRNGFKKRYPVTREAHFVAHVNAILDIHEMQNGHYDTDEIIEDEAELSKKIIETIKAIEQTRKDYTSIADDKTEIGKVLLTKIEWFETAINQVKQYQAEMTSTVDSSSERAKPARPPFLWLV